MKMRKWLAERIDPDTALLAKKYEWLKLEMGESYRWLGEFDDIAAFLQWINEHEKNSWRALDEKPVNDFPWYGDVPQFREQLRRRRQEAGE